MKFVYIKLCPHGSKKFHLNDPKALKRAGWNAGLNSGAAERLREPLMPAPKLGATTLFAAWIPTKPLPEPLPPQSRKPNMSGMSREIMNICFVCDFIVILSPENFLNIPPHYERVTGKLHCKWMTF